MCSPVSNALIAQPYLRPLTQVIDRIEADSSIYPMVLATGFSQVFFLSYE